LRPPYREAQKEKELIEKKLARMEAARSLDVSALQAELDSTKGSIREQLKEKDVKINELIEELGNTQAMLSDKSSELEQVPTLPPLFQPHHLPKHDDTPDFAVVFHSVNLRVMVNMLVYVSALITGDDRLPAWLVIKHEQNNIKMYTCTEIKLLNVILTSTHSSSDEADYNAGLFSSKT
jgi:hypothetical protein